MSGLSYSKDLLKEPTIATVIEDSFWYYGKAKPKAKVNIQKVLTLQETVEPTLYTEIKSNSKVRDQQVKKTVNYIEMYIPDEYYTYPSEQKVKNDKQTLHGATADYIPEGHTKPLDNGKNGEKKLTMARVIYKNTRFTVTFIDGEINESENGDNKSIKIIGRTDDAVESEDATLIGNKLGNTGGISKLTASSATRSGRFMATHKK